MEVGAGFCLISQTGSVGPASSQLPIFKDVLRHRLTPKKKASGVIHVSLPKHMWLSCRECAQGVWNEWAPRMNGM